MKDNDLQRTEAQEFHPSKSRADTASRTTAPGGAQADETPGYLLLGELGRGGMGVVYHARQAKLNREVALKMLLGGNKANRRELIRFLAEGEALAAVKHDNVVQVYEYGEFDRRPYMALEYLPGGTLAKRFEEEGPQNPKAAARLIANVARGVAAAHSLGIVHRDLKPSNVLLSADGVPKVTDFGLAKRGVSNLTQTGQVMGTPAYMAPEQAGGGTKFVGPAADVWALGVILYESLSGDRPFRADSTAELLAQILTADPLPLRGVPRDLALIIQKCLQKNAVDRYATATELANDLHRFARGEPIGVRPTGVLERIYKWARRKPTAAAAYFLGVAAVMLMGIAAVLGSAFATANRERGIAKGEQQRAEQASQLATNEQKKTAAALAGEAVARKEADRQKVRAEELSAALSVDRAYREWQNGNVSRAGEMLESIPTEFRAWEWNYVRRLCKRELLPLSIADADRVGVSPDGSRLLAYTILYGPRMKFTQRFALYDLSTKKELPLPNLPVPGTQVCTYQLDPNVPRFVFWGPDADTKGNYAAHVVDPFGPRIVSVIRGIPAERASAWGVAISADGTRLLALTQDRKARVWDANTAKLLATLDGPFATGPQVAEQVSLNSDGTVAGFAYIGTKSLRLFDTATGKVRASIAFPHATSMNVVHMPANRVLLQPYDPNGAEAVCHGTDVVGRTAYPLVGSIGFSGWALCPDGKRIAAASRGGRVRTWNLATGQQANEMIGSAGPPPSLAWSPDGQRLAAGGADRLVRVWDASTGESLNVLRGADRDAQSIAFGPNGMIVTAAVGGAIVFDGRSNPEFTLIDTKSVSPLAPRFSPDGSLVALEGFANPSPNVVFDANNGAELCRIQPGATFVTDTKVLTLQWGLRAWNPRTGKPGEPLKAPPNVIKGRSILEKILATDGRRAVYGGVMGHDVATTLHDLTTGRELATLLPPKGSPNPGQPPFRTSAFSFDPDGKWISALVSDGQTQVEYRQWDALTGKPRQTRFIKLPESVRFVYALSNPSSFTQFRLSAAIAIDERFGTINLLIDRRNGDELARLEVSQDRGKFLAFSPDGSRALIAAKGGELRVVNLKLGQEVLAISAHPEGQFEGVREAEFSPDGTRIVTCSWSSGGAKIWDGRPLPETKPK